MIQAVFVFNNHGKPRLIKFYNHYSEDKQQHILSEIFQTVSKKGTENCNFIDKCNLLGEDFRIMFRHFTTLYFVFCCDASESELAILDLIQVFVEVLDKCFKNVCELDLIFHVDRAHYILNEIVLGGVVLETNIDDILARYGDQMDQEVKEARVAPTLTIPTSLTDRLPSLKDFKMSDITYSVRDVGGL